MKLRPYQADTFELVIDKIRQKVRRMLVVAATGAGKTVLFAAFAERGIRRGSRGVILAPRQEIVQQSYRKLIDAGLEPAQVGIQLGGVKGHRDTRAVDPWDAHARLRPKAPVQLGTMPSFNIRKWIHNNPAPDWLVIDEAHLAVSATYRSFIDEAMRLNPNLVVIGLTATPYRIDGLSFDDIFDDLIVMARPGDLATWINEETGRPYLMRPDVWGVPKEKTANTDNVRVRKQKGLEADYDKEELEEASMRSDLVGSIVEEWKKRAYGHRTVAFAVGVKHSKFIVENFLKEGIPAEHLDGSVPSHERRAILKRLRDGKTLVVSNCDVLTEGWDEPIVSCAILARKTKSLRIGIQEIGRVLRDHPDKPTPVILDHAGFCLKYGGPMRYREYSLQASSPSGEDVGRLCTVCASVLDQEELILVVKNNFGEWEETDDDSMGDDDDSMGLRVVGWMCPKCRIKVWKKRRPAPKAERPGETKGELELYAEETHPARPISKALQEYNTRLENFEAENDARLRRGDRPHLPGELRFKWMSDHQGKNPPKGHKRPKLTDEQQAMIDLHEAMEEKR